MEDDKKYLEYTRREIQRLGDENKLFVILNILINSILYLFLNKIIFIIIISFELLFYIILYYYINY